MSDDEVPEPSAPASDIGPEDEEAGSDQCFSKSEMTKRNQIKSEKRELGKDRWYSQMGKVGTGLSTWDRWDWDTGVFRLGGTGWDCDRGVFRLGGTA